MTTQLTALSKLSTAIGFPEAEIRETLKRMIISAKNQNGAQCTDAELMVFTSICAKYELDPFVREVHAFVTGGKLMFCVGVDGWFKIMTRHPMFDGVETEDILDANSKLLAVKAKLYLKGISRPVTATEYLAECRQEKSPAWQKYPHRMLENKAIAQAIRRGMGISEFVEEDEKERIINASQQQQVQQQRPIGINFATVQAELESARSTDELQQKALAMREKLQRAGTWEALKGEFLAIRQCVYDKLTAPDGIEDAEIVDVTTGEIIQQTEEEEIQF